MSWPKEQDLLALPDGTIVPVCGEMLTRFPGAPFEYMQCLRAPAHVGPHSPFRGPCPQARGQGPEERRCALPYGHEGRCLDPVHGFWGSDSVAPRPVAPRHATDAGLNLGAGTLVPVVQLRAVSLLLDDRDHGGLVEVSESQRRDHYTLTVTQQDGQKACALLSLRARAMLRELLERIP
jgi:hypothetical protein